MRKSGISSLLTDKAALEAVCRPEELQVCTLSQEAKLWQLHNIKYPMDQLDIYMQKRRSNQVYLFQMFISCVDVVSEIQTSG